MKKVVINRCYGGFGLSAAAYKRIGELLGKPVHFVESEDSIYSGSDIIKYVEAKDPDRLFVTAAFSPNPDPRNDDDFVPDYRDERDNPVLVRVVEELGPKANGRFAELKVVQIPDDIKWDIREYDGVEHIAEAHRTWS